MSKQRIARLVLMFGLLPAAGPAYQLSTVKVSGDKQAEIVFQSVPAPETIPSISVQGNVVEMMLVGAELPAALQGKLEVPAPHALVSNIILTSTDKHSVKARVSFNGNVDNLKGRLNLTADPRGLTMRVDYPKGVSATLDLLKEEQAPLHSEMQPMALAEPHFQGRQLLLVVILLLLAGGSTAFFFRFLRMKGKWKGSRKYLIEQMGYCPLGAKAGVSLIKVGKEFLLVGVTVQQVTLLSSLPKLQEQYEEESSYERDTFRTAVGEEVERMQKEAPL